MPRLTRTAKFADLRNQLLNDKEEYTKSNDLSSYENKLNNVKDNLVIDEEAKQNYWKSYQEPTYFQDPVSEDPIYQELLKKEFGENPFIKYAEETVAVEPSVEEQTTLIENPAVETIEEQPEEITEAIIEEPVVEEVPIEEPIIEEAIIEEPVVEEVPVEEPQTVEEPVEFEEVAIEEKPVEEEPVVEQTNNESYFDSFMNNAGENFNSYFEDKTEENIFFENMFTNVFKDVKDESGEIVNLKERETYLNQTISDVNTYNEEIGEETINTAIDNMIDEIRHPGRKVEEPIEEVKQDVSDYLDTDSLLETNSSEDDEFNSTVSLEISKIMDEVAGVSKDDYAFDEVEYEKPEEEQLDAYDEIDNSQGTIQIDEVQNEENAEDVVEIKNIAEIEKEEGNTISQTIPFIVADSEDLLDDEGEDEDSNVVLNIILIVLIIVLVAVLGLIVFYILKTKGIL